MTFTVIIFSVVPFNSVAERGKEWKNRNPGPGSYAAEPQKLFNTVEDKALNSFTTKIARLCPTAPGSSVFKSPTYVENPAPDTYFKSLKFQGRPSSAYAAR